MSHYDHCVHNLQYHMGLPRVDLFTFDTTQRHFIMTVRGRCGFLLTEFWAQIKEWLGPDLVIMDDMGPADRIFGIDYGKNADERAARFYVTEEAYGKWKYAGKDPAPVMK
jgi:hypothetical protein